MNKKLLIAIIVVIILFIITSLVYLLTKPVSQPVDFYSLTITQSNGIVNGSISQNGKTTQLDEKGIAGYGIVGFNTPKDIMSVECPNSYTLGNPSSSSGNKFSLDPISNAVNMEILKGNPNSLNIVCTKQ